MRIRYILKNYFRVLGIADYVYIGKAFIKRSKSIGIYSSKHSRTYRDISIVYKWRILMLIKYPRLFIWIAWVFLYLEVEDDKRATCDTCASRRECG